MLGVNGPTVFLILAGFVAALLTLRFGLWGYVPGVLMIWVAVFFRAYHGISNPEIVGLVPFLFGWVPGVFWCLIFQIGHVILRDRKRRRDEQKKRPDC
jgi:hypothetical protein